MRCIHQWLLELPRGGIVVGHCRYCGERYRRRESVFTDEWNRRVLEPRRGPDPIAAVNAF